MNTDGNGSFPSAEEQAALEYYRSVHAYQNAYGYAAQGMDPQLAAIHGQDVATYQSNLMMLGFVAICWGVLTWALASVVPPDPAVFLWSAGLLFVVHRILHHRLKQFAKSDPRWKRCYLIPTPMWVVIEVLLIVSMTVGSMAVTLFSMPVPNYG